MFQRLLDSHKAARVRDQGGGMFHIHAPQSADQDLRQRRPTAVPPYSLGCGTPLPPPAAAVPVAVLAEVLVAARAAVPAVVLAAVLAVVAVAATAAVPVVVLAEVPAVAHPARVPAEE